MGQFRVDSLHFLLGAQVLYLTEPIDEPTITALAEFEGKKFVDVSREGLDLGEEEEDKKKAFLCYLPLAFIIQFGFHARLKHA